MVRYQKKKLKIKIKKKTYTQRKRSQLINLMKAGNEFM